MCNGFKEFNVPTNFPELSSGLNEESVHIQMQISIPKAICIKEG